MITRRVAAFARRRFGPSAVQFLKSLRKRYRTTLRALSPRATRADLVRQLRDAGIALGDVVMVHSSLGRLGNVEGGASGIIAALLDAIGPEGTLAMPAYCGVKHLRELNAANIALDLRTEKSGQGAISEAFRTSPGVWRSSHPVSSVCAWGKHAEFVTSGHSLDDRLCHPDSPIGRIHSLGGKILGLGIDMGPVSFYHAVEDGWAQFPLNPYGEPYVARYVDQSGNEIERPIRTYRDEVTVTRIDGDENLWIRNQVMQYFDARGLRKKFRIGGGDGWVIGARDFFDAIEHLAGKGITIYTTRAEWQAMGSPPFD